LGYGGQSVTVFPDLGVVVVITSNPDGAYINDEQRIQFLKDCIIGAIKK
jgi:predicted ATPase